VKDGGVKRGKRNLSFKGRPNMFRASHPNCRKFTHWMPRQ